jgi:hypothetical protein
MKPGDRDRVQQVSAEGLAKLRRLVDEAIVLVDQLRDPGQGGQEPSDRPALRIVRGISDEGEPEK